MKELEEGIRAILNANRFLNKKEKDEITSEILNLFRNYIASENFQKPF